MPNRHRIRKWDADTDGTFIEATIRLRHGAPGKARISRYTYEAGAEHDGQSDPGTCYVMRGRCVFEDDAPVTLEAGDILSFDGGRYKITGLDPDGVDLIWAWDRA